MSTFDIGKIRFHWTGNFDQTVSYEKDDCVYYQGDSWVYISELTPAAYDATVEYSAGDLAIDGSDVYRYIDTTPSTGNQPSTSPSQWELNTPTTASGKWQKMAQGADLGTITGISAGDLFYYDGSDFVRLPAGSSHMSLVIRNSAPIFKPQGIIQQRWAKVGGTSTASTGVPLLARTASLGQDTWGPFIEGYDNSSWVAQDVFQPEITPKFSDSVLKVELNAQVSIRNDASIHTMYRIQKTADGGATWYRPEALRNPWMEAQVAPFGEWGQYQYTSNGATFVYQVAPAQYQFIDDECVAGTTYRYRLEARHNSGTYIHFMGYDNASSNDYSRTSNSWFMVSEINNGD